MLEMLILGEKVQKSNITPDGTRKKKKLNWNLVKEITTVINNIETRINNNTALKIISSFLQNKQIKSVNGQNINKICKTLTILTKEKNGEKTQKPKLEIENNTVDNHRSTSSENKLL